MTKTCSVLCGADLIAGNVRKADTFFSRFLGLQGRRGMGDGEGLLISPCNQIHSFNMRFDIDVLFLSGDGTVMHMEESFKPNKISPRVKECTQVLELKGGSIEKSGIQPEDVLTIVGW